MLKDLFFYTFGATNQLDEARMTKNRAFATYYGMLTNILCGIFSYENISRQHVRRLNKCFLNSTYVGAFEKKDSGVVIAPVLPVGDKNSWDEYSAFEVVLPDGSRVNKKTDDIVIGTNYDVPTLSDSFMCYDFAESLSELKLSIKNSIILSRKTALIEVPNENALNEALTKFNNHTIGNPVMVNLKRRDEEKLNCYTLAEPTLITDYYEGVREVINEFLTCTGLSSLVNPNKKERLLVDEISSTDDIKNTLLSNRIENRFAFIDEVNERFGTDWQCSIDSRIYDTVNDLLNVERKETTIDGSE